MFIYEIRNIVNNKIYIGQTIQKQYKKRWRYHRWHLRNNKHENVYLQNSWNKYGEDSFLFNIIETCQTQTELNHREDVLIKEYRNKNLSYNMTAGGRHQPCTEETRHKLSIISKRNGKKLAKTFPGLIGPDSTIYDPVVNLTEFCQTHNLERNNIRKLYNGKWSQWKGWRMVNPTYVKRPKKTGYTKTSGNMYKITGPDGTIYTKIDNITQFAKEHDLSRATLYGSLYNKRNIKYSWKVEYER
jgi:group I intron endonuclease